LLHDSISAASASEASPRLEPTEIPKYVTPLVILPAMRKSDAQGKQGQRYSISVRPFSQQILPGGLWEDNVWGIIRKPTPRTFNATPVFGYGPSDDPEPDGRGSIGFFEVERGVAPAPNSQFNYPGYTVENVRGVKTSVDWHNDLIMDPWMCDFDTKPDGDECMPIQHILPVDQSLSWANPGLLKCEGHVMGDCRPTETADSELAEPYTGPVPIVIHVHGGHTKADSDGYPAAWWLPKATYNDTFKRHGTLVNRLGRTTNSKDGIANFVYSNDQPSATLWYHDHTLGMTRNNVYAGMAGFWLVREKTGGETGLVKGRLPHGAPKAGESFSKVNLAPFAGGRRQQYRDISIMIQDKSFYENGTLYYPPERADAQGLTTIGSGQSDISPIWNPEVFFDVMVVNGVSWPVHQVEPDIYRFRFLNGCNSRFLNLALCIVSSSNASCPLDSNGAPQAGELDFFVIGSDQGLLSKVVRVRTGEKASLKGDGRKPQSDSSASHAREALLMSPGERWDVLIDFRELPAGTVVRLINTGPDAAPFRGFDDEDFVPANESTTGQVMEFHVVEDDLSIGEHATSPDRLQLNLPDAMDLANLVDHDTDKQHKLAATRDFALLEENSTLFCVDEDGVEVPNCSPDDGVCVVSAGNEGVVPGDACDAAPFGPVVALLGVRGSSPMPGPLRWNGPISANPRSLTTEVWEFWNWSPDSHAIHVHAVKFKVLERFSYTVVDGHVRRGAVVPESLTEKGWKDTVIANPGQVARIAATFDIDGLFIWECNMLEHQDNEMRLPFCVGDSQKAPGCAAVHH
jgi:FtsP/CotA-like multicopper oxidase with cupredoxin domain